MSAFLIFSPLIFLQKEIPRIMRQGMDEMLKYEKKAEEEKKRVYTYEKAVERYRFILWPIQVE